MGYLSDTYLDALLDQLFGAVAPTIVSSYDVALSTTPPATNGTGVTEPVGAGYARAPVANNATSFPASSLRQKSNGVAIAFPQPTGSWGTIGWFVIYEHGTSNMVAWGQLAAPLAITASSTPPTFQPGTLSISGPGS